MRSTAISSVVGSIYNPSPLRALRGCYSRRQEATPVSNTSRHQRQVEENLLLSQRSRFFLSYFYERRMHRRMTDGDVRSFVTILSSEPNRAISLP